MKGAWEWFNGKKTVIGTVIILAAEGVKLFFPELIEPQKVEFIQSVGMILGGVGLVHKGTKTETWKKISPKGKLNP